MTAVADPTDSPVDVGSRRWLVAVHEAGHVSAARSFDWRVSRVALTPDGGGLTSDSAPMLRERSRRCTESALISLAGPCADEKLLAAAIDDDREYRLDGASRRALGKAGLPEGCEIDMDTARRLLVQVPDLGYPEALGRARLLVHRRWPEIERVARVLYRRAELDAAQVRAAARR